jgi:hypothetical protein
VVANQPVVVAIPVDAAKLVVVTIPVDARRSVCTTILAAVARILAALQAMFSGNLIRAIKPG